MSESSRPSGFHFPYAVGIAATLGSLSLFLFALAAPNTWIGGIGWSLGYWLYEGLETTSGFVGMTQSYEVLLGWPIYAWLLGACLLFGAAVWILAELIRIGCLRAKRTS